MCEYSLHPYDLEIALLCQCLENFKNPFDDKVHPERCEYI